MRKAVKEYNQLSRMLMDAINIYNACLKKESKVMYLSRKEVVEQVQEMVEMLDDERQLFESIKDKIEEMRGRTVGWFWTQEHPSRLKILLMSALSSYRQRDELVILKQTNFELKQELQILKQDHARERREWETTITVLQQQWMREQREYYTQQQKALSLLSQENASLKKVIVSRLNQDDSRQFSSLASSLDGLGGDMSVKNC